ncbi:MAG: endolytic transglycosylase MltG [Patescibacteria group bacterium]
MNPQHEQGGRFDLRFLFVLGGILLFIVLVGYFFYGLQPATSVETLGGEIVHLKITKGEGFKEIAAHLSRESLIRSIGVFKLYAILTGRAQKFQPGAYELSPTMNVPQILDMLSRGGRNEVTVTIPEGSTLKDINDLLTSAGVLEGEATLSGYAFEKWKTVYPYLADAKTLEGFLFPDTYRFKINAPPEDIIERLLSNFDSKAWPIIKDQVDWYDRLVLASILEREVPTFEDRQMVAGILLKRIALKIPLQVDATIGYAKCGGELKNCKNSLVTKNDLSLSSPYNTYQHLGWPPGPISNPGEAALSAAVKPQKSPYLYYLSAAKTKETLFSKTLDEHNTKRARYL